VGEGSLPDSGGLEISLVVEQVAFGGQGLGRLDSGKVCFVPRVIPGERIVAHVTKERSSFAEGEVVRLVEASPDRVKPPCPVYGRCGGCHYQHVAYPRQLTIKRDQVADVLRRLGGQVDPPVEETEPSPLEFHYRNRITVHAKSGYVGFFGPKSRKIIEMSQCLIATDRVNGMLADLRASRPRDGEHPLREPGEYFGFRQVNDSMTGRMLEIVEEMARPGGGLLVDAYCGAGFFAKRLKPLFTTSVGIEWSADSIRAARQGATDQEVYLLGDVRTHLAPALERAPASETTLLLDPPAEGLDSSVLDMVLERRPARIIYVSCNPSTLARDLKKLSAAYGLKRAKPMDMFPQTAEIEVASLLELL
jgi:23S rRNA (uracil1939-C5)-methyltransferase